MTDTLLPAVAESRSFTGRRFARSAAAVASSGLLVGLGAASAAPAVAAEATDCTGSNTVDASTGDETDIQALLDANTAIVCLQGSFLLTQPLSFDHGLTLFGLTGAELDGNDLTRLVTGSGGAALTVQNMSFVDGSVTGDGGAIFSDGDLLIEDSQFSGNTATNFGGAVFNDSGETFDILGSTFTSNSAALGGAVYGDSMIIEESTFTTNVAQAGGAVFAYAMVAYESTFTENEAGGGAAILAENYAAIAGSTFVGNAAESIGGAVATYGAYLGLNSTFVENSAGDVGGAIFAGYGQVGLSTFLDNESGNESFESDAIFTSGSDQSTFTVVGNIFAGSRSAAQLGADEPGLYIDGGGNVFSTAQSVETALGTPDPSTLFSRSVASIFGPGAALASNGGSTQTVALIAGSPAIDAVPADSFEPTSAGLTSAAGQLELSPALEAAFTTAFEDQRSVDRTGLADAGAYEYGDAELGDNELAATGADSGTAGWLAAIAALLLGSGAAVAIGARRRSRSQR